ncbi:helix-turn-helix transcriptional regulator [Clostridium sp. D33t1_170424_F3]|uniref:helix-turn-helix domain-containing protein n=1 Tax=Clostridium sp. D33t1_170424_F3 TaxID=2787099 RepID=UPI0018AB2F5A|nr:helix-turn-helix transcriptional regulator [Clostridium sp. D33t1_170424_F3]
MQWILQDVPLGRNIQTVRMEKQMTQQKVAEQLQLMGSTMSRTTLANIETGRRNIKASDLKALKTLFNVSYDAFFTE